MAVFNAFQLHKEQPGRMLMGRALDDVNKFYDEWNWERDGVLETKFRQLEGDNIFEVDIWSREEKKVVFTLPETVTFATALLPSAEEMKTSRVKRKSLGAAIGYIDDVIESYKQKITKLEAEIGKLQDLNKAGR